MRAGVVGSVWGGFRPVQFPLREERWMECLAVTMLKAEGAGGPVRGSRAEMGEARPGEALERLASR